MFFQNYETLRLHILNSCFQIPKFLKPSSITNTEDHILRNLPCVNYILKPIVSNSNSYLASFHSLACHSILMFSLHSHPLLAQIIHYALPRCSETFVHRSGRTGRAGKKGTAILIYTQDESRQVRIIERDTGCKFLEVTINHL
jgi:hypothetical protein